MVLVADDVAVLAFRRHQRRGARPVRLNAIGAVIDPACVRVAHDDHARRTDEIAAVELVPFRGRNLLDIDVLAFVDIIQQRSAIDLDRRNRGLVFHVFAPVIDEAYLRRIHRQIERDIDARHRGQDIGQHPVTLVVARNVVEHDRRVGHFAHMDIDNRADLLLAVGARHVLQLPRRFEPRNPVPQILVRHDVLSIIRFRRSLTQFVMVGEGRSRRAGWTRPYPAPVDQARA